MPKACGGGSHLCLCIHLAKIKILFILRLVIWQFRLGRRCSSAGCRSPQSFTGETESRSNGSSTLTPKSSVSPPELPLPSLVLNQEMRLPLLPGQVLGIYLVL